eukprot:EG_transcript_16810
MPTATLPALLLLSLALLFAPRGGRGAALPLAKLTSRDQLGAFLEASNMTVGAELGVQKGYFASTTLSHWPSCQRYYLVDAWQPQENYSEAANVPFHEQEANLVETRKHMQPFGYRTVFLRMFTSEAAKQIPDASLDYVYIDARHDYCGAKEDLLNYWPKVRPGGIFAGHDFYYANNPIHGSNDWSLCQNGERHVEAVKGAVVEFAQRRGLPICVTREVWPSWLIRKPIPGTPPEPWCMSPDAAATHDEHLPIPPRLRRHRKPTTTPATETHFPISSS